MQVAVFFLSVATGTFTFLTLCMSGGKKETHIFSLYSLPQKGQNFVGWFNADVTSSY